MVDELVDAGRAEGEAERKKGVHLVGRLGDLIVLVGSGVELLGAIDEGQDGDEGLDGVGVAVEVEVRDGDVVVGRDVGGGDTLEGRGGRLARVEGDVVDRLEGEGEVAEEDVDAEEAEEGEVAEGAVERTGAVSARDGLVDDVLQLRAGVGMDMGELGVDVGALDEGVEDVEDGVGGPDGGIPKSGDVVLGLVGRLGSPGGKGLVLVQELIQDIPQPLVGQFQRDRPVGV